MKKSKFEKKLSKAAREAYEVYKDYKKHGDYLFIAISAERSYFHVYETGEDRYGGIDFFVEIGDKND